jgi:hypothetical protein
MSADVGRKLQSCREEEHENAREHMPFHQTHLINWLAQQQVISRVSIESHAGSIKATQSFLFFLCTINLPNHRILTAATIILQVAKELKNEAPFLHST